MIKRRIYRQSEKLPYSLSFAGDGRVAVSPRGYSYGDNQSEVVFKTNTHQWINYYKNFYANNQGLNNFLGSVPDDFISNLFPFVTQGYEILLGDGGFINIPEGHDKIFIECPVLIKRTKPDEGDAFITSVYYGAPSAYESNQIPREQSNDETVTFLKIKTSSDYPSSTPPQILSIENFGSYSLETYIYKLIIPLGELTPSGINRKSYGEVVFFNGCLENLEDYLDFSPS